MNEPDDTPERVSVTGTDATPDTAITMLEGATGARIPTGEHRRSGAMPTGSATDSGNGIALLWLGVVLGVLGVIAAAAFFLSMD